MTINVSLFRAGLASVASEFQGKSRYIERRADVGEAIYIGDGKGATITKSRLTPLFAAEPEYIINGLRVLLKEIPPGSNIVTCLPMHGNNVIEYAFFADDRTGLLFETQEYKGYRRTIMQLTMTWGIIS